MHLQLPPPGYLTAPSPSPPFAAWWQVIERLVSQLEGAMQQLPAGFTLQPISFEKDDDTNYHMQVSTAQHSRACPSSTSRNVRRSTAQHSTAQHDL